MNRLLTALALYIFPLLNTPYAAVNAAEYGYHPSSPLRLGAGMNPSDLLESYPVCFDYEVTPVGGTSGSSIFRVTLLESRRDFLREMSLSASMSGHYKFFSGGASFGLDEGYSFSEDSLTWTVYLSADFGRQALKNERPNQVAAGLLQSDEHQEFARRCGTELVVQERRSALIAAVFSVSNLSEAEHRRLTASLNASASGGVWSAEVAANYSEFVAQAAQTSQINLSVVTIGGPGGANLAPLITDYGDLSQITSILKQYATSLNFENAVSSSYLTASMERYGWDGTSLDLDEVNFMIGEYYFKFQEIQEVKTKAEELLRSSSSDLSTPQKDELRGIADDALRTLSEITKAAKECRETGNCRSATDFTVPSIVFPVLSPIGKLGMASSTVTCEPVPKGLVGGVNFICRATYRIRAAGRWEKIASTSIFDESGNEIAISNGPILSVREAAEQFVNAAFSGAITEAAIIRELVGDGSTTFEAADSAGWTIRVFNVDVSFGAAERPSSGDIRRLLTVDFAVSGTGERIERQVIVQ